MNVSDGTLGLSVLPCPRAALVTAVEAVRLLCLTFPAFLLSE